MRVFSGAMPPPERWAETRVTPSEAMCGFAQPATGGRGLVGIVVGDGQIGAQREQREQHQNYDRNHQYPFH